MRNRFLFLYQVGKITGQKSASPPHIKGNSHTYFPKLAPFRRGCARHLAHGYWAHRSPNPTVLSRHPTFFCVGIAGIGGNMVGLWGLCPSGVHEQSPWSWSGGKFPRRIVKIQHQDFTCNNQLDFMTYHVINIAVLQCSHDVYMLLRRYIRVAVTDEMPSYMRRFDNL